MLTCAKLLDLGELRAQTIVDPREHVMSTQIVGRHVGWVDVHCHVSVRDRIIIKMQQNEIPTMNPNSENKSRDEIKLTLNLTRGERVERAEKNLKLGHRGGACLCVEAEKMVFFFFFFPSCRLHKYSTAERLSELCEWIFFFVFFPNFGAYNWLWSRLLRHILASSAER